MKKLESLMAEAESTTTTSAGSSPAPTAPSAPAAPAPASNAGSEPAPVEAKGAPDEDWGELSRDEEGSSASAAKPAMKPTPKTTPAASTPQAATPPVAVPAAPKPGEAAPAAQPAAPVAQTPPAATPAKPAEAPTTAPQAAVETPEAKAAREKSERDAKEKKQLDNLVEFYKIPDEWAARLPTEPELVLPQLAARLHHAVMQGVQNMLDQGVPQVVQGMMQFQQRENKAKEEFYSRWPNLRQYEKQVLHAGQLFSQLNPTATPEERIERIGKIVSESLGIPVAPTPAAPPAAPQAPAPAFRPAGGGVPGTRPPAPTNEFEAIAESLMASGE